MPPADAPLYTSEQIASGNSDARWLGRRARNVARRPLVLALFTAGAFLVALLAVIALPSPEPPPPPPPLPARQDTIALAARLEHERARLTMAESALVVARQELAAPPLAPTVVDTFPAEVRVRRGVLAARIREISAAVRRASDAPLPTSYRALAELPELAGDSSVIALVDSLGEVERRRGQAEAAVIADTAFMALTARLSQIGDSLVRRAERAGSAARRELRSLLPVPAEVVPADPVDTMALILARDSSRTVLAIAERRLLNARHHNDSVAALAALAPRAVEPGTAPGMLVTAAAVSGLALGFLVALSGEIRRPAVADAREAEVVAGLPVLAQITDADAASRRTRRSADRDVPPLIELTSDRYDGLYYRLADSVARLPQLAVLGDDPAVVAIVSANLAAAAARTARATLLVDADFDCGSVSGVLRVRREPGMAEVLANRIHWSSAVTRSVVGRDRVVDVLPAGTLTSGRSMASAAAAFGTEVARIGGRYDTLIVSAPVSRGGAVSAVAAVVPDAVVCVQISRTPVRLLQRIINEARADGARLRGLVLWTRSLDSVVSQAPAREKS